MSVWSNIERCAVFMFRRLDRGFHARALEKGGGFIAGGRNYGQGSSREHATLSALHLGVRAVLARDFARIHRRNLLLVGILPLLLEDSVEQGERLEIVGGARGARVWGGVLDREAV